MSHTAELIAVGTELLLGNIANTDAQMLSQGLSALVLLLLFFISDGERSSLKFASVFRRASLLVPTCKGLCKK